MEPQPTQASKWLAILKQTISKVSTKPVYITLAAFFIVILVIAVVVLQPKNSPVKQSFNDHQDSSIQNTASSKEWPVLWGPPGNPCEDNPSVKFTALPIALENITFIEPMGELKQGHIVPGDHIGINYNTSPTSKPVKVFAPADGTLITVERHAYTPPAGYPQNMRHYHFYLIHSCTFFTGFVHLTEFSPEILSKNPKLEELDKKNITQYENLLVNIPVKAGQEIGTAWSFGLLGMVTVDLNRTNTGYLKPESYRGENWRIHSVSPFEYFESSLQRQILSKNPRQASPRGGKIDFDIDGKLVGNWFEVGTGGFRDLTKPPQQCGNFPCPYWEGHVALVYDYIDPGQLRVSIGHDWGLGISTPYGVKGNSPNFKEIGIADGMVKYKLVALKDMSRPLPEQTPGRENPFSPLEISGIANASGAISASSSVQALQDNKIQNNSSGLNNALPKKVAKPKASGSGLNSNSNTDTQAGGGFVSP